MKSLHWTGLPKETVHWQGKDDAHGREGGQGGQDSKVTQFEPRGDALLEGPLLEI